jgi:Copper type II ascorbate-dependent monooxygenase, C-terminal domain
VPNIPAYADNFRLTQIFPIRQDMELFSIQPHMHVRGRSIRYTAVFPDGHEEELLNVPHYDFNWQIVYQYAKRVTLPAGTTIRVDATWDNSTKNRYNPSPEKEVLWGEQSWDEMLSPTLRGVVRLDSPVTPTLPSTF